MRNIRKSKLVVKSERVKNLLTADLREVKGGVTTAPNQSWVYSCVVSCTWTSDCTTSTTF